MAYNRITIIILILVAVLAGGTIFRLNQIVHRLKDKNHNMRVGSQQFKQEFEQEVLEFLVPELLVYDVYDNTNSKIKFIRFGSKGDGGYVVPEIALQNSDALLGYGIASDISFEEGFSDLYNKPSYGFDCGAESINIKNPLCKFIRECIASDSTILGDQTSSGVISSFTEQLNKLGLVGKNVFIKMDIEGAEYDAFEDIYQYANNITGIVLELHSLHVPNNALKAARLLRVLERNFYMVRVHGNNCCHTFFAKGVEGGLPSVLEVTLINKNLVGRAEISQNQSHPDVGDSPNVPTEEDLKFRINR